MARKLWVVVRLLIFVSILLVLWNVFWIHNLKLNAPSEINSSHVLPMLLTDISINKSKNPQQHELLKEITIACVVCGNRVNETLVLMKSALIFSKENLRFIIFVDNNALVAINNQVSKWPLMILHKMKLELHPIMFPSDMEEEWKKLFKPCASQRLFLPVSGFYILTIHLSM